MKTKRYSKDIKIEVVEKYIAGISPAILVSEYKLSSKSRIYKWHKTYINGNTTFEETRGKATKKDGVHKGRKKKPSTIEEMSKDDYIKYLEMENDILKYLADSNQD